jgi:hypothetical protein
VLVDISCLLVVISCLLVERSKKRAYSVLTKPKPINDGKKWGLKKAKMVGTQKELNQNITTVTRACLYDYSPDSAPYKKRA